MSVDYDAAVFSAQGGTSFESFNPEDSVESGRERASVLFGGEKKTVGTSDQGISLKEFSEGSKSQTQVDETERLLTEVAPNITAAVVDLSDEDLDKLEEVITKKKFEDTKLYTMLHEGSSDFPRGKPEIKDIYERLMQLTETSLQEIRRIRKDELTCRGSDKEVCRVTSEALVFSTLGLFAVINLLGVTADIDPSAGVMEVLKKLMVIPASLSTLSMYTGGALQVYDGFMDWVKDKASEGSGLCASLNKSFQCCYDMNCRDFIKLIFWTIPKNTIVGGIAVWSSWLDAKNTALGVSDLVVRCGASEGAARGVGIGFGVGTGITESALPLITLPELARTIAAPAKGLALGRNFTKGELHELLMLLDRLVENDEGVDSLDSDRLSGVIRDNLHSFTYGELRKLQSLLRNIQVDTSSITEELSQRAYDKNQKIGGLKTHFYSGGKLVLQGASLLATMWTVGTLVSSNQKLSHYNPQLEARNLTIEMLPNITLQGNYTNLAEQLGIEPFPIAEDVGNLGSYGCIGIALYPYVQGSAMMVFEGLCEIARQFSPSSCLPNGELRRDIVENLRKFAFQISMATIGATFYGAIVAGAQAPFSELINLESLLGIDTSLLPRFDEMGYVAIAFVIMTLLRGAYVGAGTIWDHMPKPLCCRGVEVVEVDEVDDEIEYRNEGNLPLDGDQTHGDVLRLRTGGNLPLGGDQTPPIDILPPPYSESV
ncbi:hypothetical protein [Endozoicomonas atrinae]|uniref:hypothetical protein n=1 Tax=Endozoicomonas atrinae TaxID=1333660 RepID=UPI00082590A4|nr:hypothetical protein [Endozoicomonas atrinae]